MTDQANHTAADDSVARLTLDQAIRTIACFMPKNSQDMEDLSATLSKNLTLSVQQMEQESSRTLLASQTHILNAVFNWLLQDAERRYDRLPQYTIALRAQRQCQSTVHSLRGLQQKQDEQTIKET